MDESSEITNVRAAVVAVLGNGSVHSEERLDELLSSLRTALAPSATDKEVAELRKQLIQQLQIDVDLGQALTSDKFSPWLADRRSSIDWRRWTAYKKLMLEQGRPVKVMNTMGALTDDLLELVGDPTQGGMWARRGLVIGDVQSGKTGTYLGLFNKAADAGYRLIIVLAGTTELLRQQTQERIDESFVGRDTSLMVAQATRGSQIPRLRHIGVGRIDKTVADVQSMTTVFQDFRKTSLLASNITVSESSPAPYVFVLKKNKHVLNAVQVWLSQQAGPSEKINLPLLLLDDEADYASVNTSADESATAINDAIRRILGTFHRSSYVAFTATPFANILIDHERENDLFPRDYIYSLETPSNYVGAEQVFGTSTDVRTDLLMDVTDAEQYIPLRHKSDHAVEALPHSLKLAIRTFLIASAIRDLRGHGGGRSMLVNVSRFKRVQNQVFNLVD